MALNIPELYEISHNNGTHYDTTNKAISGGAVLNIETRALGYNNDTKKARYYWRVYITTTADYYITTAKQHSLSISLYTRSPNDTIPLTTLIDKTLTVNINTDINDEVILYEEILELDTAVFQKNYHLFSFNAFLNVGDATVVRVSTEKGTTLATDTKVSVYHTGVRYDDVNRLKGAASNILLNEANNFTDEENLTIGFTLTCYPGTGADYPKFENSLYAYISFDGGYTCHLERVILDKTKEAFMNKPKTYTFEFTEEERELMRQVLANSASTKTYIMLMPYRHASGSTGNWADNILCIPRTLTIINANPILSPIVKDTNATTKALTGDEKKIVRYSSNAYVASNVVLQKHAGSIKNHIISVGGKSTTAQTYTFNGVEGSTFTFSTTDSRGYNTTVDIKPPFVDYVKLTCNVNAPPVEASDGTLNFKISGNYFNGTFGAKANNLGLSYRVKEKGANWGSWVNVSGATFNGNTYSLNVSIGGFNYQKTYELQAMATDRLNTITTPIQVLTTIPVFDWSRNDFNFNVPVNFSETADFNGVVDFKTTSTFEGVANFWRTANFHKPTVIYDAVEFKEGANINSTNLTIDNNPLADYIIETGTEEMGSNGVWKWQKWKSGKAEAWGKRNFGNMGVSTTYYGSIYQSPNFTQDLPSIFSEEPDVIEINIIKTNAGETAGAFVLRGLANDASSSSTGSFAIAKRNSGTLSQVYLGFHIVGTWKSEE